VRQTIADNCVGGRFSDSFVAKTAAMQIAIFLESVGAARIRGILIRLGMRHVSLYINFIKTSYFIISETEGIFKFHLHTSRSPRLSLFQLS
jgi:hypothetical protein